MDNSKNGQDDHVNDSISLIDSILLGDLDKVSQLIENGADVNFTTTMGTTALHYAAEMNSSKLVLLLLGHGAKSIKDKSGQLPEDMATDAEVIKLLQGKKTSLSHPFVIDFIDKTLCPELKEARIGMSMCPGRVWRDWSRDLDADLEVILNHKVNVIASIITNTELRQMNHNDFYDRIRNSNLESLELSIHDKWLPNSVDNFMKVVNLILEHLQEEKTVLVHCNGGRGRTGLVVGACLFNLGYTIDQAINTVRTARTGMLRNPAQEFFLRSVLKPKDQKNSPRGKFLFIPLKGEPLTPRSLSQPSSPRNAILSPRNNGNASPRTPRITISNTTAAKKSPARETPEISYDVAAPSRMTHILESAGASGEIPIDYSFSAPIFVLDFHHLGEGEDKKQEGVKKEDTPNCT